MKDRPREREGERKATDDAHDSREPAQPLILGSVGVVLSIAGPIVQKQAHVEDSHVFAAIFLNILGIVGGLMLMAVWLNWKVLG